MNDFNLWWEALPLLAKGYWSLALPATVVFLVMMALTLMGSDADIDADDPTDSDGSIISVKTIVGFFTFFSWTGIATLNSGAASWLSLVYALIAGILVVIALVWLMSLIPKLSADGTTRLGEALLKSGEVYLTIPPMRTGLGKVQVAVNGGLRELEAMTDESGSLGTGTQVVVIEVLDGGTLLVSRLE
ncbi:hypothetical protein FUAX_52280 (plasmid) [Fulvitalea axinellae]|uniref:NfeD-like C-terminal domain-containing protein n=1 Tax=Fulvitalea axinellae TaxID=1182444 RepID=A0AAU9CUR7_9BACT|nr:hypothetical protein FUAX_52280 [Fulvitalea axinellae]